MKRQCMKAGCYMKGTAVETEEETCMACGGPLKSMADVFLGALGDDVRKMFGL